MFKFTWFVDFVLLWKGMKWVLNGYKNRENDCNEFQCIFYLVLKYVFVQSVGIFIG